MNLGLSFAKAHEVAAAQDVGEEERKKRRREEVFVLSSNCDFRVDQFLY